VFTFMKISCWILLKMKNVLNKTCGKKIKPPVLRSVTFFQKSCRLWDNVEKIWCSKTDHKWQHNMTHAHCILGKRGIHMHKPTCPGNPNEHKNAHTRTHTQKKYIIFTSVPRQQLFRERALMLHDTYITCRVDKFMHPCCKISSALKQCL
jgi:hypothetical protein